MESDRIAAHTTTRWALMPKHLQVTLRAHELGPWDMGSIAQDSWQAMIPSYFKQESKN